MERPSNPALFIGCLILSMVFVSCSSARYQQGFSYRPAYAGPDVASGKGEEKEILPTENTSQQGVESSRSTHQEVESSSSIQKPGEDKKPAMPESSAEAEKLSVIISREYQAQREGEQSLNNRELLHKMASEYVAVQNKQLTTKQLRKLDKYAAKMEKKQQRHSSDVNWKPEDNLELFILLGAGVALVVGILGVGIGWFVFLGLALVYLYLKLLKNN